jgi:hypothetical protein
MRRLMIFAGALAAAQSAAAPAAVPQVEQGLAFIVGDWTIDGFQGRYRDNCTWFDEHAFVVCDTTDGRHGKSQHHVAVIGWSAETGNYTYLGYGQDGSSRSDRCFANNQKGLTCLGENRGKEGLTEIRSYIWPTPTGLGIRQERSLNGGPWKDVGEVAYIRNK